MTSSDTELNYKAVTAFKRWDRMFPENTKAKHVRMSEFIEFLNVEVDENSKGHHMLIPMHNAECERLIDMILGPHGDTVLKMLHIRNMKVSSDAETENTG